MPPSHLRSRARGNTQPGAQRLGRAYDVGALGEHMFFGFYICGGYAQFVVLQFLTSVDFGYRQRLARQSRRVSRDALNLHALHLQTRQSQAA